MRGSAARGLLPALLVLGLVTVVAVAATGSIGTGTDRTRPASALLLDTILTLGLLWVLTGAAILVWALTQRKALGGELAARRQRRSPLASILIFVLFLLAALAYWRLRNDLNGQGGSEGTVLPPEGTGSATPPTETTYEPGLAWPAIAVVAVLALVGLGAYLLARRRERRLSPVDEALAEQLAGALDDSLEDLRAETDPRRAVIAAYARLERVLGSEGLPRRATETPDEYLARILASLEIRPVSVRRLTSLYAWAKFSHHEVAPEMKEDAILALETVRDELRRVQRAREEAEAVPAPVGAAR